MPNFIHRIGDFLFHADHEEARWEQIEMLKRCKKLCPFTEKIIIKCSEFSKSDIDACHPCKVWIEWASKHIAY